MDGCGFMDNQIVPIHNQRSVRQPIGHWSTIISRIQRIKYFAEHAKADNYFDHVLVRTNNKRTDNIKTSAGDNIYWISSV